MTPRPTPRLVVHALLAVLGLLAAVLLRAPVLVVLVAPSLALLAIDLPWRPAAWPAVRLGAATERLIEGGPVDITIDLTSPVATTLDVDLELPASVVTDEPATWTVSLDPDVPRTLEVTALAARWGAVELGPVHLRTTSPAGLLELRGTVDARWTVRVLPRPATASELVEPTRTHQAAGNRTADARGSGTEFADLRPYLPGDRARDVNWRVSARRGSPWITERHPERRTDVVLLLDAYDAASLPEVLRAARAIAQGYLAGRDRVGVTTLGGVMRWVEPGSGVVQEHRIADALLDSQVSLSYVAPAVAYLPPRALPPGALVVGVTPGTDPRLSDAAVSLRARGRDVAVVVLEPALPAPGDDVDELTDRLVELQRRAVRDRLHVHGVPAVGWDPATPVDTALVALQGWRGRHVARTR